MMNNDEQQKNESVCFTYYISVQTPKVLLILQKLLYHVKNRVKMTILQNLHKKTRPFTHLLGRD